MLIGCGSRWPPILPGSRGTSRDHTDSDLRCYLAWCAGRGLDPFLARRRHLELSIRWMQEVRRFRPSTVSRRFPVTAGFYRTCVIGGVLEHSPAEYARRPAVPAESPALGFTHLQSEALLTAARQSANPYDFALVPLLGLLGLRGPALGSREITTTTEGGDRMTLEPLSSTTAVFLLVDHQTGVFERVVKAPPRDQVEATYSACPRRR